MWVYTGPGKRRGRDALRMKFVLVDRILELQPGQRIVTCKALTLAEEYLADHFPTFPVMPGVLMVEASVQSAAWLVRATTGFTKSIILLSEARNVTYKSFVAPGHTLMLTVEARSIEPEHSEFECRGSCDGQEMVKARLRLRHSNLADRDAALAETDARLIAHARRQFDLLGGPSFLETAVAS